MSAKATKYYVYLLECSDGSYYCGQTNNLQKRLRQHNEGEGGRYTRTRTPVRLVYTEQHKTRKEALKREAKIKKMTRGQKEELIGWVV
ncbi:MAG: GIY-YIG nuclease family protein [Candidatus Altiarchaeales archaeon]|nr:GIY-YIG nuclease family protein [Candidatus Altiarchaeales archaeon]MBD3416477.1 GIY-YIG nuclease family protein [Candidatus Altiarchaeales archaeon]